MCGWVFGDDAEAKDCSELYEVMKRDFWVVTPCYSVRKPGHVMEGTRLTLVVRVHLGTHLRSSFRSGGATGDTDANV